GIGIRLVEAAGPDVLVVTGGSVENDVAFFGIPIADQVTACADPDRQPAVARTPGIDMAVPGEVPVAEEIGGVALGWSQEVARRPTDMRCHARRLRECRRAQSHQEKKGGE